MFEKFLEYGSIFSVVLMTYAGNVMMEALRMDRFYKFQAPPIITTSLAAVFMILSIPCAIWPAIYIGLFSGFAAGAIGWVALQVAGAIATIILGIRGPLLGIHFLLACIAFPIGYYLSLANLP